MVRLLTSGLYTSIQDAGRYGYRSLGVPISGAMNQRAMRLANSKVGNSLNSAVLECTMQGPTLVFDCDAVVAISGAVLTPTLNGSIISMDKALTVKKGDVLSLGAAKSGVYSYVAVEGGWDTKEVLGSVSQYIGISPETHLTKSDVLTIASKCSINHQQITEKNFNSFNTPTLEVFPGPEFHSLSFKQQLAIVETHFSVGSGSNRMAYRLMHNRSYSAPEIITAPVQPGTVQFTPFGDVIVLMRDAQTTGGYSRILQLTEASIDMLSQKRTKDLVKFKMLT